MDLTIANQGGTQNVLRDYRKGNWTLQETMVLIEAKKMDDERRMKRVGDAGERAKPAELRWKWVEDYCWKNGCFRNQNQCNDKWDNLMRDFKKVREYERIAAERGGEEGKSYWGMEKTERKDKNLPSNTLPQIYEALVEVVERKGPRPAAAAPPLVVVGSGGPASLNVMTGVTVVEKSTSHVLGHQPHLLPSPMHQCSTVRPPTIPPQLPPAAPPSTQPLPTPDSETSEYSDSPAKRRKRRGGGEGTSGAGGGGGSALQEVGSTISRSASMIAQVIQSCEERGERRHREIVRLQERRLQIEESKAEINRQGINGMVDAINKLANSIFARASHTTQSTSK